MNENGFIGFVLLILVLPLLAAPLVWETISSKALGENELTAIRLEEAALQRFEIEQRVDAAMALGLVLAEKLPTRVERQAAVVGRVAAEIAAIEKGTDGWTNFQEAERMEARRCKRGPKISAERLAALVDVLPNANGWEVRAHGGLTGRRVLCAIIHGKQGTETMFVVPPNYRHKGSGK